MKSIGNYHYKEKHAKLLLMLITDTPKNTKEVTLEARQKLFPKLHAYTVKRLLLILRDKGLIKNKKSGRIMKWFV